MSDQSALTSWRDGVHEHLLPRDTRLVLSPSGVNIHSPAFLESRGGRFFARAERVAAVRSLWSRLVCGRRYKLCPLYISLPPLPQALHHPDIHAPLIPSKKEMMLLIDCSCIRLQILVKYSDWMNQRGFKYCFFLLTPQERTPQDNMKQEAYWKYLFLI